MMRGPDLSDDYAPVEPATVEQKRAAARAAARNSDDAGDLKMMLDMLGIEPGDLG